MLSFSVKVLGRIAFMMMLPIWFLCSRLWWKENDLFILNHVYMMMENPRLVIDELLDEWRYRK